MENLIFRLNLDLPIGVITLITEGNWCQNFKIVKGYRISYVGVRKSLWLCLKWKEFF